MCDCDCDTITNGQAPTVAGIPNNLVLSNLYASNVFANFISVSNIFIPGSSAIPGYVLAATGTGIQWVAQSGGGGSQWTGSIGTPIYYVNPVGIGSSLSPTATLMVTGNIYASNAIQTPSLFATSANIGTVNASNVSGNGAGLSSINASNLAFGIVPSSLIYGNTLSNINASNLAFGIVSSSLIYGNTLSNINASNIVGLVNISGNTLSNIQSSNISQPFANLVVSNSVTTTNVVTTSLVVSGAMTSNVSNTTLFYDTLTIPYVNTLKLTASSIISLGGVSSFSNLIVSNLQVTNTLIITATNTQTTNSLSIINQGTATALYVNQNEFPNMSYNVAEFWDHTQLAMVIDGYGNVAVHTASSPGYALTVVDGAKIDKLTVSGSLIASGNTLSNIQSSNISQPFANLVVSNSVTTTNVFVTGNLQGPFIKLSSTSTNLIVGLGAMSAANPSNGGDIAIGANALQNDTAAGNNTAIGANAMQNASPANGGDIAIGANALQNDTGFGENTAIGKDSMNAAHPSSGGDVAIGRGTLQNDTGPGNNTAIGDYAMQFANSPYGGDIAIGANALASDTGGGTNTAIGYGPMQSASPSYGSDVAIGESPLQHDNGVGNNIALGTHAMQNASPVQGEDVAIGKNTLKYDVGQGYNVALGTSSMGALRTGSYNTALGYNSAATMDGLSNTVSIGAFAAPLANNVAVFSPGMNVGINTGLPRATLEVSGNVFVSNAVTTTNFFGATGQFTRSGSAGYLTLLPYNLSYSYVGYGTNFVAIGYSKTSAQSAYLTGSTWELSTGTQYDQINKITYGNSTFVAVGYGKAVYSGDGGQTWTDPASIDSGRSWLSVAYGPGFFVAVSIDATYSYSTNNALVWSHPDSFSGADTVQGIAYGNGYFVAVGLVIAPTGVSYYTTDPSTGWTPGGSLGPGAWGPVAYGLNGPRPTFVAIDLDPSYNLAWSQDYGASWTLGSFGGVVAGNWKDIAYGNGVFVVISTFGTFVYSTDGGQNWTQATITASPGLGGWFSVTYGNGYFMALGSQPEYVVSVDGGVTWTNTYPATSYGGDVYASNSVITTNFIGDGSLLTNLSGTAVSGTVASALVVTQASQPAITSVGTLTSLTSSGTVSATQFSGDGSLLTNLTGSAVSGTVRTAQSVTQAAQSNITSVGTLTSLTTSGQVKAVGNVSVPRSGICPPVIYRQGTSGADWSAAGTANTPVTSGAVNIQVGAIVTAAGTTTPVTFPQAYVNPPIVLVTKTSVNTNPAAVGSVTRTGFNILQTGNDNVAINWLSIGI